MSARPPRLFRVILPVDDLARADAFWERLLRVEIDRGVPGRHYLGTAGAIPVLVDKAAHARAHGHGASVFRPNPDWAYFRVPDLDAVWARAVELECPTSKHGEGPGIALRAWGDRSFYTYDPAGNPICLIDDVASEIPPERVKYSGRTTANLCNIALPTRSMGRSEAFFEELLQVDADGFVPNRHSFALVDCQLTLVDPVEHAKSHELPVPGFRPNPDLVYFAVSDLDACYERAQKLGMQAIEDDDEARPGIHTHVWGERSFYGLDPSENPICCVDDQTLYLGSTT